MRRTRGCLGNTPTFLAVCKKCSRRFLCTGDAGHGPPGSTHSYPDWAAFPAAFFIAYGRPNHERSSPPCLTVLLLPTGKDQEEGDGASEREDGTSGVWAPRGSFLFMPVAQENKRPQRFILIRSSVSTNTYQTLLMELERGRSKS